MPAQKTGGVAIPPLAYIIIGAGISIYAKIVQSTNPEYEAMTLFFYIGIIFVVVGVGKFLLNQKNKEASIQEKQVEKSYQQQINKQQQAWQQKMNMHNQTPAQHNIIACPRCNTRNYSSSNFCYSCGSQLR